MCYEDIRINHYFMRSETAFQKKLERLGGAGRQLDVEKMKYWKSIPLEQDVVIIDFLNQILNNSTQKVSDFLQKKMDFKIFIHDEAQITQIQKSTWKKPLKILSNNYIPFMFKEGVSIN